MNISRKTWKMSRAQTSVAFVQISNKEDPELRLEGSEEKYARKYETRRDFISSAGSSRNERAGIKSV